MKRVADGHLLGWLEGRTPEEGDVTGYDATGWDASVWILHAMYETQHLPGGLTHDDVHQMERAAGAIEPVKIGAVEDLEELLTRSGGYVVGSRLGRSEWPGPGWQRLRWSELARRLDVDPFAIDVPPCFRSFPYTSWPANIEPPAEGSLDREQYVRLVDHLASLTPGGDDASCTAFYAMCAVREFDEHVIYTGKLKQLVELYENEELPGSPSNFWPDDMSWFVYTDWDLWATKVSGSRALVDGLTADSDLETVSLKF
ncbi:MAG: hypothetical protein M3327_10585 [Actinomycetota bacterium]|nr:hypothetical protein [Actinomycetota bacterium]